MVAIMKKFLLQMSVVCMLYLIITNAQSSVQYASEAMDICFSMVIPTLFPFFICSGLLIYSGFCERLAHIFRFCMKPLFNVAPAGSSAFVLGIISGYPMGAVTAGELYKAGYVSKTEAERLLAFCNNSGPLFILGSVGLAVYSELSYGVMLYVCHVLAAVTVGIIFGFYKREKHSAPDTVMTAPERGAGEIFGIALDNAVKNMLTVCGAVVFFSVVSRTALGILPLNDFMMSIAKGLTELVTGTAAVSELNIGIVQKLVITAFIVGFAGLSVHVQVMAAVAKYGLSLAPYIFGKLLHGITAALYTFLYLHFNPVTEAVFAPSASRAFAASSASVGAAVAVTAAVVGAAGLYLHIKDKDGK